MTSQPTGPEDGGERGAPGRAGWPTARAVFVAVAVVGAVAGAILLLWLSRRVITWLLIAALLAAALDPAVNAITRRVRMPRLLAISLVYFAGLAAAAGVALLLVPPLIDAAQNLVDDAPGYIDRLRDAELFRTLEERYDLLTRIQRGIEEIPSGFGAGEAVDLVQRLVAGIFGTITVLVLTFFFLLYGGRLRHSVLELIREEDRPRWNNVADRMYATVGGYVRGNLLISLIAGVTAYIALAACGVPFAPALAFWVAVTDLLPLIGATIGAIPCVAVGFFQGWVQGFVLTGFFVVYQQVENHFIQPNVMRRTTDLNAFLVLVAVLLGAELLGIFGALIAIPVAGMIQILVQDWIAHRPSRVLTAGGRHPPPAAPPKELERP